MENRLLVLDTLKKLIEYIGGNFSVKNKIIYFRVKIL